MRQLSTAVALLVLCSTLGATAAPPPRLLQDPSVSATRIAFAFAGEIWTVPREGGEATRLVSGQLRNRRPIFSPDGASVAFTGTYDDNEDVYVVAAGGGEPRRLTHHPGPDVALGFTPDGKRVLFAVDAEDAARPSEALHRAGRGRPGRGAAAPVRGGRLLLARRQAPRLRPLPAVAGRVEEVPGRADDARLDRGPLRLEGREGAARELERPAADVGRRYGLLPLRSQRPGHALRLRPEGGRGPRGREEPRRLRRPVRLGRTGRDRLRPVRRAEAPRPRLGRDAHGPGHDLGRPPAGARGFPEGRARAGPPRGALADGQARPPRGARRDPLRSRREGRRAEPDAEPRRRRPRPVVLAGREERRVALGRVGRVRAPPLRTRRDGAGEEDRPGPSAVVLLRAALVARLEEDRPHRQADEPLGRRRREGDEGEGRLRPLRHAPLEPRPGLVCRLALDRLREAAPEPPARRLRPLARGEEVAAGDGRPERRGVAAVRPEREVPLLPRQHRRRPRPGVARHDEHGAAGDEQPLRRRPPEGPPLARRTGERRGGGGDARTRRTERAPRPRRPPRRARPARTRRRRATAGRTPQRRTRRSRRNR